jgi:hypothetical protein
MALCDLFLFSKVKMLLMGKRFQDMEEIKWNVTVELLALPGVSSKSASDNGMTAGRSVWCLKGTTLKGIRTATPQVS